MDRGTHLNGAIALGTGLLGIIGYYRQRKKDVA